MSVGISRLQCMASCILCRASPTSYPHLITTTIIVTHICNYRQLALGRDFLYHHTVLAHLWKTRCIRYTGMVDFYGRCTRKYSPPMTFLGKKIIAGKKQSGGKTVRGVSNNLIIRLKTSSRLQYLMQWEQISNLHFYFTTKQFFYLVTYSMLIILAL